MNTWTNPPSRLTNMPPIRARAAGGASRQVVVTPACEGPGSRRPGVVCGRGRSVMSEGGARQGFFETVEDRVGIAQQNLGGGRREQEDTRQVQGTVAGPVV